MTAFVEGRVHVAYVKGFEFVSRSNVACSLYVKLLIMESSNEDDILRNAVRQNLDKWLQKLDCSGDVEKKLEYKLKFVEKLRSSPVAVETERANEQHYEVPTDFFRTVSCIIILRGEI